MAVVSEALLFLVWILLNEHCFVSDQICDLQVMMNLVEEMIYLSSFSVTC